MKNFITPAQAQKWADALRSGKYKQTKGQLEGPTGNCCLGVACKIFVPKKKLQIWVAINNNKYIKGSYPTAQPYAPEWLQNINDQVGVLFGTSLSTANDGLDYTFDEIADLLESTFVYGGITATDIKKARKERGY
jgi:hypothetical protein